MSHPAKQRADSIDKYIKSGDTVAELGVFTGMLSHLLLENRKNITLHMVDKYPSKEETSIEYKATHDFHSSMTEKQQNQYYEMAKDVAKKFSERAHLHREWTQDAASFFEPETFDLVFVDADHSYDGCKRDLKDWYPLVKSGGVISGHDYANTEGEWQFGVTEAVNEFIEDNNLTLELGQNYTWFARKP